MEKICIICGEIIPKGKKIFYCSKDCAKEGKRIKNNEAARKRYKNKKKKYAKFRNLICADCGITYIGHFNSKFCDDCVKKNHPNYYRNRTYLESEIT